MVLVYRSFDLMHTWCCGDGFLTLVWEHQRNQLEYSFCHLEFYEQRVQSSSCRYYSQYHLELKFEVRYSKFSLFPSYERRIYSVHIGFTYSVFKDWYWLPITIDETQWRKKVASLIVIDWIVRNNDLFTIDINCYWKLFLFFCKLHW